MIKLIFCGDRFWRNKSFIRETMDIIRSNIGEFVVIEGEASGADSFARDIAEDILLKVEPYPADWEKYKKAAGPIRNAQMLKEGKPHGVVAFHRDLLYSRGTKNMVEQALKAGLPVWICTQGEKALIDFILEVKKRHMNE
jgi:hypothetical protein